MQNGGVGVILFTVARILLAVAGRGVQVSNMYIKFHYTMALLSRAN